MKKALKTIATVVCAALTLSLTGCQKDPDELILGTWNEDEVTWTYTDGDRTETFSGLEEGETAEITFKNDNTYTTVYHSNDGDGSDNGTWSIKDDKLTIITNYGNEQEAMTYNIDKLTKKVCNLSYNESYEGRSMSIVMKLSKK